MASYNELNALIDAYINRNGVQAITGQILNGVLKAMVEQLGRGYTIMGAAEPTTDPGTPDGPECYFASETGTYTDFDGLQVVPGELALLCYTPTDGWTKATIYEGFQEVEATIDGNVGTPSVGVSYADGVLSFDFRNLKGNTGDPAGFGTIAATVDGNIGTPGVSVQTSGPDTAKNITFQFTNLKGETGVTSVVATVDNTVGTPTCTVSLNGQQLTLAFSGLKGAQGDTGSSVDYPFTIVNNLTTNDATQALSAAMGVQLESKISQLEAEVDENKAEFDNAIQDLDGDTLYITDADGNVIAKIDSNGIKSIEAEAQGKKLSNSPNDVLDDFYEGILYVTDSDGNVVAKLDENGLSVIKFSSPGVQGNDWFHKKIATYGDSITALNGGDFSLPYGAAATTAKWANKVAKYFSFSNIYNRGIGSTCFKYGSHGGPVAWCRTATGEYVGRSDSYNYDNYVGNVTIPADCTPIRGDGSSWLRITTMFPASIKDTIDVVLVMFHNDFHQDMDTEVVWIPNDATDPEWAASDEYETLGGDYNVGTVRGGIASVVMKLQAWMPQAKIVLMTPISGVYATADGLDGDFDNTESAKMKKLADTVLNVAFRMSIPSINVYGTDGVNSLNRTGYISDTIHPYTDAGCKQIARSVIGGLKGILPELDY